MSDRNCASSQFILPKNNEGAIIPISQVNVKRLRSHMTCPRVTKDKWAVQDFKPGASEYMHLSTYILGHKSRGLFFVFTLVPQGILVLAPLTYDNA